MAALGAIRGKARRLLDHLVAHGLHAAVGDRAIRERFEARPNNVPGARDNLGRFANDSRALPGVIRDAPLVNLNHEKLEVDAPLHRRHEPNVSIGAPGLMVPLNPG
jgi:hypothetical protein